MSEHFPQEWLDWIQTNKDRGCDSQEMVNILIKNGFSADLIRKEVDGVHLSDEEIVLADQYILANTMERLHYWLRDDWINLPFAIKLPSDELDIYTIDQFLSKAECNALIKAIKGHLKPSSITRPVSDKNFRTSSSCDLGEIDLPLVKEVDFRISRTLGIHTDYSEHTQGQFYKVKQQFKPHPDYFDDLDYADHCYPQGQRTWTFMVYLNKPERGGETEFVEIDLKVKPKTGMAVIWNNLHQTGGRNRKAYHQGLPVKKGYKAILTKWFRQFPRQQALIKEPNEFISPLTTNGWAKFQIPSELFEKLQQFYLKFGASTVEETVPGGYVKNQNSNHGSTLLDLPDEIKSGILKKLKPLVEKWSGVPLAPVTVYGIRTYLEGTTLEVHRDRVETHIASVIMNIEQEVYEAWPLYIEDHHYRSSELLLQPGEMIFYEGARLAHGRPTPLNGKSFSNVFVHYKPISEKGE